MNKVIIFKNDLLGVSVVYPTSEALALHTIEEIAIKDVPAGKLFKIVDVSEIPTDRAERNLWTVDDADLTDGIGGESNEFGA